MTHERLHNLTDGIFAIVMTLMVLELKLPSVDGNSSGDLWHALRGQSAVFISYVISFALLWVYWRAHNFIISMLAKNVNLSLTNINGIFLFLVGLIPFSTQILGSYPKTPLALCVYALNVILIGLTLIVMRAYVENSESIENLERTREQRLTAFARMLTPIVFASIAILLSFVATSLSFVILLFSVFYNFYPNAGTLTLKIIRLVHMLR